MSNWDFSCLLGVNGSTFFQQMAVLYKCADPILSYASFLIAEHVN